MGRKAKQTAKQETKAPPAAEEETPAAPAAEAPAEEEAPAATAPAATPEPEVVESPSADPTPQAVPSEDEAQQLTKYDLTSRMTPFLDRHLVFPILQFLEELGVYKKEDITRCEIALLSETNMIDFVVDKYKALGEEAPESITKRRDEVIRHLSESCNRVLKLLQILENPVQWEKMQSFKSIGEICMEFDLDPNIFDGLVSYAKLQYDCGNYSMSRDILKHYRGITSQDPDRPQTSRQTSSIWGSVASSVLNLAHEDGAELLLKLDEVLDNTKLTKREILTQRAWLLHWSLFCIFQADGAQLKLLDMFLAEKSLSIISLACPHLFRYVSACLILHKRMKSVIKETVQVICQECTSYSDPITRFLLALYVDMDFDQAQLELKECELVCRGDYFLHKHWTEFEENARLLIFETYCRIHQCINIEMIASKLNMRAEEAELWIVKLIQNAKLDARIDSEKSRVVMSKAPPNVYQQVIEKTKNLSFRTTMLLSNLESRDGQEGKV